MKINTKKIIKKALILLGVALFIGLALQLYSSILGLKYVEYVMVENDKIYILHKNDGLYTLYESDQNGFNSIALAATYDVSNTEKNEFISMNVTDDNIEMVFKRSKLDGTAVEDDKLTITVNLESGMSEEILSEMEFLDPNLYLKEEVDGDILSVDVYGNIYKEADGIEQVLFENDGNILTVDNLGYQYKDGYVWFYNISSDSLYKVDWYTEELICEIENTGLSEIGYISDLIISDEILATVFTEDTEKSFVYLSSLDTVSRLFYNFNDIFFDLIFLIIPYWIFVIVAYLIYKKLPTISKIIFCFLVINLVLNTILDIQLENIIISSIKNNQTNPFGITVHLEDETYQENIVYYENTDLGLVLSEDNTLKNVTVEYTCTQEIASIINLVNNYFVVATATYDNGLLSSDGVAMFATWQQDGEIIGVAETVYWTETMTTGSYLSFATDIERNIALISGVLIVLFTLFLLFQINLMNRSIKKKGYYHYKGRGITEMSRLKTTLNDMSQKIKTEIANMSEIKDTYASYMPPEILIMFNKKDIRDLRVGDKITVRQSVLILRSYNFSEIENAMNNEETFLYVDDVFKKATDIVVTHKGFVNEFYPLNVMALFKSEDLIMAQKSGMELLSVVRKNQQANFGGSIIEAEVELGVVGCNTQREILTVSKDLEKAENLTYLSYLYQCGVLLFQSTFDLIWEKSHMRCIGYADWNDTKDKELVYEDFTCLTPEQISLRIATMEDFASGVEFMIDGDLQSAKNAFIKVLRKDNKDHIAYKYFEICNQ